MISNQERKDNIDKAGRRDFLKTLWKVLGLVALAEILFFLSDLMKSKPDDKGLKLSKNIKELGFVDDFKVNSVETDRANKVFMIRDQDGGFLALSLLCSHLGCSVVWNESQNQFVCPCHSSAFDQYGNVLSSPAPRALDYYPVVIEEGKVKIDLNEKKQRKNFNKSQITYVI